MIFIVAFEHTTPVGFDIFAILFGLFFIEAYEIEKVPSLSMQTPNVNA